MHSLSILIFDVMGIIAFSISGFIIGIRREFDILGIGVMAVSTSSAGGIIRDAIISKPPFICVNIYPSVTIALTFIICIFFKKVLHSVERKLFFVAMDAIGLVSFSFTGAFLGLAAQYNLSGVILLAFITSVGGSLVRDMLISEVPFIFREQIYGIVAIYLGFFIYFFEKLGFNNVLGISLLAISGFALRMIAYLYKWRLPKLY